MQTTRYLAGAGLALAAVTIWAGWSAVTRFAVTSEFDAFDVSFLRFGVAGAILLPVVLRRGLALDRLGWRGLAVLVAGGGVPYVLLAAAGLQFAPAHHQAALNPGFMPLFVAALSVLVLGERLGTVRTTGLGLIFAGAIVIVALQGGTWHWLMALGHAMFLAAALLWACFSIVVRWARLDPLHATALVATCSAVLYVPIYAAVFASRLAQVPLDEFVFQAVFQGVIVTILSLVLYARAIALIGAAAAAAFGALVPGLTALIAIPLLGEWPTRIDWLAMALVSAGVYLSSGGPLPGRRFVRRPDH